MAHLGIVDPSIRLGWGWRRWVGNPQIMSVGVSSRCSTSFHWVVFTTILALTGLVALAFALTLAIVLARVSDRRLISSRHVWV